MASIRKILVATDTWHPEVNGVVRTYTATLDLLRRQGYQVEVIEPNQFWSFRFPFYPDVRVAWPAGWQIQQTIERFAPDAIHIATEGTIGLAVRNYCTWRRLKFTTAYHTKSAEYLERLAGLPSRLSHAYLRWFHARSQGVMVATPSVEAELRRRGFRAPLLRWSRGVNLGLFYPRKRTSSPEQQPVLLYVGRVSREKNLEAFLDLKCPGTKVVVGDGPHRQTLMEQYPAVVFPGKLTGEALAEAYASADAFVFPSRTDTFGLVIIEALASGLPVAAYPAPGPIDILTNDKVGAVDEDLGRAVETALQHGDGRACVALARQYSWEKCTRQFVSHLVEAKPTRTLTFPTFQASLYPTQIAVSK